MKIKEIVVKKEIKISVNYNTFTVSGILTAELTEGDDYNTAYKELSEKLYSLLLDDLDKQVEVIK